MVLVTTQSFKFLFTILARPSEFNNMILSMMSQTTFFFEFPATEITDECIFCRMVALVFSQVLRGSEGLATTLKYKKMCGLIALDKIFFLCFFFFFFFFSTKNIDILPYFSTRICFEYSMESPGQVSYSEYLQHIPYLT